MDFYTNVFINRGKIYCSGYLDGERYRNIIKYRPYMFLPSRNKASTYHTHTGKPVEKVVYPSITEARKDIKRYSEIDNGELYGLDSFVHTFINDTYPGEVDFDPSQISIAHLDLECASDQGFPDITLADKEITAITIMIGSQTFAFGCGAFYTDDENIEYVKCLDEMELLVTFVSYWSHLMPDVITGWNTEFFDIPYLVNRIRNICGQEYVDKLSPWGIVEEYTVNKFNKEQQSYDIKGVASLDYLELYKKFSFKNHSSYRLDAICHAELGERKTDYSEYGSLLKLYQENYQLFMEYNIRDVHLVAKLDGKLGFLNQVLTMAYDAKINYEETLTTVKQWDVMIHNELLAQNIVIPPNNKKSAEPYPGGFVKEIAVGAYGWGVSMDYTSLYPKLIETFNISPDVFVGRDEALDIEAFIKDDSCFDDEYSHAANGSMYLKKQKGFLAKLMADKFAQRNLYKKKMLEAKKDYERTKDPKFKDLIAKYNNLQMAKKIQLNSAYGALGNAAFRWFSMDHAPAITLSGQLAIQYTAYRINRFMNKICGTKDYDYIIAIDTDSNYVCLDKLIQNMRFTDKEPHKIVDFIDKFCKELLEPEIDKSIEDLCDRLGAFENQLSMKRESIFSKSIWVAKKRYALNVYDVEGVRYDTPQLKMTGIEAVRSSTPAACRDAITKGIDIIMNGREDELQDFIAEFRWEYDELPFEDIAYPRGMNGLEKYDEGDGQYASGTPIHVKGAILYNHKIQEMGLQEYPLINNGDKIKFCYLVVPNPLHDTVISVPGVLPPEFDLHKYLDREMMFEKSFMDPLRTFLEAIKWHEEPPALNLEDLLG